MPTSVDIVEQRAQGASSPVAPHSTASPEPALSSWIRQHSLLIFLILVAIGSLRIIATYSVFNATADEPNHLAAGTEWLDNGTWKLDISHPPLARVAAALGPWLASDQKTLPDATKSPLIQTWDKPSVTGVLLLHRNGAYDRNVALMRLGVLPFFWIASLTVYLWARRYLGEPSAAFAVFFFTFLPAILAHAGIATTDMALTAFAGATFLMTFIWVDKPGLPQTVLLGLTAGLALLSKFSAVAFIPVALLSANVAHAIARIAAGQQRKDQKPSPRYFAPACIAAAVCFLALWAGYRFSFGMMTYPGLPFPVPAPEYFNGVRNLFFYNINGHPSFLLGQFSKMGWWYFFPVTLAVKTPLPFLALTLFGAVAAVRGKKGVWLALAFSLGILAFMLTSHLNLGVRHVLPVYIGFSIVAGAGAERLLSLSHRMKWTPWVLATLTLWMTATSVLSHPDYLPYFNELVGDRPERVLVDSDLDWGQDYKRLAVRLKQLHVSSVNFNPYFAADLAAMGYPPVKVMNYDTPTPGWNIASITGVRQWEASLGPQAPTLWMEKIAPFERVGEGMLLWHFPPEASAPK